MKTVALELQPCCGNRSGVGIYTYELVSHLKGDSDISFCGNIFNFLGRNDNSDSLKNIEFPINESRLFPYGVYRRVWNCIPISYSSLFPMQADLSVFFNYIVPPRIKGKVITMVHDMTYLRFPETVDKKNLRRIEEGIRYSVERSSRIITASEFSRREIIELLDLPAEKVSVVNAAANISSSLAHFDAVAKKFGIEGSPYILYVGNIEPRKNLVRLLKAFALLKEKYLIPHKLVMVGASGWNNANFYKELENNKFRDDIVLTGYVSSDEKNAFYQNAEVFAFPSIYEGFGIPPLEAMHWRCPVVAANAASLPEVCGEAAELVDPFGEEAIAEGILKVISDIDLANELRKRGVAQVDRFNWEKAADCFCTICKEVAFEQ